MLIYYYHVLHMYLDNNIKKIKAEILSKSILFNFET